MPFWRLPRRLWLFFFASPSGRVFVGSSTGNSLLFRCAQKGAQANNAIPSTRKRVFFEVRACAGASRTKKKTDEPTSEKRLKSKLCVCAFSCFSAPRRSLSPVALQSRTDVKKTPQNGPKIDPKTAPRGLQMAKNGVQNRCSIFD